MQQMSQISHVHSHIEPAICEALISLESPAILMNFAYAVDRNASHSSSILLITGISVHPA